MEFKKYAILFSWSLRLWHPFHFSPKVSISLVTSWSWPCLPHIGWVPKVSTSGSEPGESCITFSWYFLLWLASQVTLKSTTFCSLEVSQWCEPVFKGWEVGHLLTVGIAKNSQVCFKSTLHTYLSFLWCSPTYTSLSLVNGLYPTSFLVLLVQSGCSGCGKPMWLQRKKSDREGGSESLLCHSPNSETFSPFAVFWESHSDSPNATSFYIF